MSSGPQTRGEERHAVRVVPVQVREQDGPDERSGAEHGGQAHQPGAGIEDEPGLAVVVADGNAGRRAAVPEKGGVSDGRGAAHPAEVHAHGNPFRRDGTAVPANRILDARRVQKPE